jgi:hypothetical protein
MTSRSSAVRRLELVKAEMGQWWEKLWGRYRRGMRKTISHPSGNVSEVAG